MLNYARLKTSDSDVGVAPASQEELMIIDKSVNIRNMKPDTDLFRIHDFHT